MFATVFLPLGKQIPPLCRCQQLTGNSQYRKRRKSILYTTRTVRKESERDLPRKRPHKSRSVAVSPHRRETRLRYPVYSLLPPLIHHGVYTENDDVKHNMFEENLPIRYTLLNTRSKLCNKQFRFFDFYCGFY